MASRSLALPSGFQQVDPQGVKYRQAWGAPGIYSYGDMVESAGNTYVCIAKSSVLDYPPTSPTVWQQIGGSASGGIQTVNAGTNITVTGTLTDPIINAPNGDASKWATYPAVVPGSFININSCGMSNVASIFGPVLPGGIQIYGGSTGGDQPVAIAGNNSVITTGGVQGLWFNGGGTVTFRDQPVNILQNLSCDGQVNVGAALGVGNTKDPGTAGQILQSNGAGVAPSWTGPVAGCWSSSQTQLQTGGVADTPTVLTYDTPETIVGGVTLTGSSGLTVPVAGYYNIYTSIQLDKSGGGTNQMSFWLRVNGTDVPRSTSSITVQGATAETLATINIILQLTAGQYVEVVFASADATMAATAYPATTTPYVSPATPSVITAVTLIR